MNCVLDDWPLSSKPHGGEVHTRYYIDRQGTRYLQNLCDAHAGRFWVTKEPGDKPLSSGFLKKKGITRRWNTAKNGYLSQSQRDYLDEKAQKELRRRFEET